MGSMNGKRNTIEARIKELRNTKVEITKERDKLQSKLDVINGVKTKDNDDRKSKASADAKGPCRDYFMDYVFPEPEPNLSPNGKKRFLDLKRIYIKTNHVLKKEEEKIKDEEAEPAQENPPLSKRRKRREEDIVYVDQLDQDILDMI